MAVDLLPSSLARTPKGSVFVEGVEWVRIFCANCGAEDGLVPKANCTFAFALCVPCSETFGDTAHFYKEPDAVFYARVRDEQLDRYGTLLTGPALLRVLDDPGHPLTKLVRDFQRGTWTP